MNTAVLLQKLLEIEISVGKIDALAVRAMLRDVEDLILDMERRVVEMMVENGRLRAEL